MYTLRKFIYMYHLPKNNLISTSELKVKGQDVRPPTIQVGVSNTHENLNLFLFHLKF